MKSFKVLFTLLLVGVSLTSCSKNEVNRYSAIKVAQVESSTDNKASDNQKGSLEAAVQQGFTEAGFINDSSYPVSYVITNTWSASKDTLSVCIKSVFNSEDKSNPPSPRIMPAGCVNITSEETGIRNAVGAALLPVVAKKIARLLRDQVKDPASAQQGNTVVAANGNPGNSNVTTTTIPANSVKPEATSPPNPESTEPANGTSKQNKKSTEKKKSGDKPRESSDKKKSGGKTKKPTDMKK